ncbi:thioredoxin family protein [Bogoriella caseilytica]|uniref:Thioredoxin n=1 Tax=Bogoriella caseilytica TaxID=56055 RepID=A0A3N2B8W8_9MICO|nr:thioredoxin family protein [Bogoriella caseilytica]ROR71723.1 thioredoxin [Bogoriella caseilytica]
MADLLPRLLGVLALLLVASAAWLLLSRRRGTLRTTRRGGALTLADFGEAVARGDRLSIVQISAPICSNCRASERRWRDFTGSVDGAAFSVVMADDHLGVVSRLGIMSTPSSAVFDATGTLRGVIRGVPSREQIQDLREQE